MVCICIKCKKEFSTNYHLNRHHQRKIPCDRVIQCDNCLMIFKTKQILSNHQNRKTPCKKVDLEQEVKKLKAENEKLKLKEENRILNQTINNNSNNTQNNTVNNILVFTEGGKYYKDRVKIAKYLNNLNIQDMSMDDISNCIDKDMKENYNLHKEQDKLPMFNHLKCNSYIQLIKLICFNINYPENWIFIYDYMLEKTQIKVNKDDIEDVNNKVLLIIYIILKDISKKETNEKLHDVYQLFIERYENDFKPDELIEDDYEDNLNLFIKNFNIKIYNNLIEIEKKLNEKIKKLKK